MINLIYLNFKPDSSEIFYKKIFIHLNEITKIIFNLHISTKMPVTPINSAKELFNTLKNRHYQLLLSYIDLMVFFHCTYPSMDSPAKHETREEKKKKNAAFKKLLEQKLIADEIKGSDSWATKLPHIAEAITERDFYDFLTKGATAFSPHISTLFMEACRSYESVNNYYYELLHIEQPTLASETRIVPRFEKKFDLEITILNDEFSTIKKRQCYARNAVYLIGALITLYRALINFPNDIGFSPFTVAKEFFLMPHGTIDEIKFPIRSLITGSNEMTGRQLLREKFLMLGITTLIVSMCFMIIIAEVPVILADRRAKAMINKITFEDSPKPAKGAATASNIAVASAAGKAPDVAIAAGVASTAFATTPGPYHRTPAIADDSEEQEDFVVLISPDPADLAKLKALNEAEKTTRRMAFEERASGGASLSASAGAGAAPDAYIRFKEDGTRFRVIRDEPSHIPKPENGYLVFSFSNNRAGTPLYNSYIIMPQAIWDKIDDAAKDYFLRLILDGAQHHNYQREEITGKIFHVFKARGHAEGRGGIRLYAESTNAVACFKENGEKLPDYLTTAYGDFHTGSGKVARVPIADTKGFELFKKR